MNIGIKDEDFVRGKVPMTKEEIRILTLVKARITPDTVVYDVGAGTGSISIEAARMAPQGHVYAIEKNPDGIALIAENAKKFGAENITIVEGTAPDALADLPERAETCGHSRHHRHTPASAGAHRRECDHDADGCSVSRLFPRA